MTMTMRHGALALALLGGVALFAGVATLAIAVLGAIAGYVDNYFTTSVGQWVANDLRLRIYEHLHRLSLRYYDHAKIGTLVSTITNDVSTIQDFASSSTLDIVVDLLTIIFMIGLMWWMADRSCAARAWWRPARDEAGRPRARYQSNSLK